MYITLHQTFRRVNEKHAALKLVGKVIFELFNDVHFKDCRCTSDTHHFDLVFEEFFAKCVRSPKADLRSVECRRVTCLRQHSNVRGQRCAPNTLYQPAEPRHWSTPTLGPASPSYWCNQTLVLRFESVATSNRSRELNTFALSPPFLFTGK